MVALRIPFRPILEEDVLALTSTMISNSYYSTIALNSWNFAFHRFLLTYRISIKKLLLINAIWSTGPLCQLFSTKMSSPTVVIVEGLSAPFSSSRLNGGQRKIQSLYCWANSGSMPLDLAKSAQKLDFFSGPSETMSSVIYKYNIYVG